MVLTQYGAWKWQGFWYVPAFPGKPEFCSKTPDIYMAFVMVLDAVKLKARNQG